MRSEKCHIGYRLGCSIPGLLIFFSWGLFSGGAVAQNSMPLFLGCANFYNHHHSLEDTRLEGGIVYGADKLALSYLDYSSEYHRNLNKKWKKDEARLLERYQKTKDYRDRSNYGVALMHNNKSREALDLFEDLIGQYPEEYPIAANLGTCYELVGNNHEALEWIERSVGLHEGSHEGTEWLHIAILKAKIGLSGDPEWLDEHSIIDVEFGRGKKPAMSSRLREDPERQAEIFKALRYQLRERVQLVKSPDPIVARLLFELSNFVAYRYTLHEAWLVTQLALSYVDESDSKSFTKLLKKRDAFYFYKSSDSSKARFVRNAKAAGFLLAFALLLSLIPLKFYIEDFKERQGSVEP